MSVAEFDNQAQAGSELAAAQCRATTDLTSEVPGATLDRKAPMQSARTLIDLGLRDREGRETLRYHRGEFWHFDRGCYRKVEAEDVNAVVWRFLERSKRWVKTEEGVVSVPFQPDRGTVANVFEALKAVATIDSSTEPPAWLIARPYLPPPRECLAVENGLLHLPSGKLYAPTPYFFGQSASEVTFNPSASPPVRWLTFLHEVFGDDVEAIRTLQEWFGYVLTPDTSQQKILLVVGLPRSGKGTIARVLSEVVGRESVAAPTVASLSAQFGLQPLIGKPLAIISDARLGERSDAATLAERLLSISGEDAIGIQRKFRADWTGRLPTRFMLLTNELPHFSDSSGALPKRFLVLQLTQSFYGHEDPLLTNKLLAELPGVLNWAREGYEQLRRRGHFVQPASSQDAIDALETMASPISAFIGERCVVGAGHQTSLATLFAEWGLWCFENSCKVGTRQVFGRDLLTALPGLKKWHPRTGAGRDRGYQGIGISPAVERGGARSSYSKTDDKSPTGEQ